MATLLNRRWAPVVTLALCLLLFYGPILLSAGTLLTSPQDDNVAHMLISLGDARPGGRFFHYFDLSANARLWGQDVKYHPLHLVRWASIALGATPAGWGLLIIGVHALLFLAVYHYSRALLRVSPFAALAGAAVAFFTSSWLEWVALVYWTAGAVLLAVSIGEYGLFLATSRRRHLLLSILANAAQAYVTQAQALIPTQAYLAGAVLLMAVHQKGKWRETVAPLLLRVWPLTALAWIPILAPMLFAVGSGLTLRDALHPGTWGFHGGILTALLGLLSPAPDVLGDFLMKLGWLSRVSPPNSFLFGSFLFLPALLALWRSGRGARRLWVTGSALYLLSVLAPDVVSVPSPLIQAVGFSRLFAFPLLSGFVVAAAMDLPEFGSQGGRPLLWLYGAILGCAALGFTLLLAVDADSLSGWAARLGLLGSGAMIPKFLRDTRFLAAGIGLGLAGYFWLKKTGTGWLRAAALFLTVVPPALCYGQGQGWYMKAPELDAMVSPPPELRFLRERMPGFEYRAGFILSSEFRLAHGDWQGFWSEGAHEKHAVLTSLRENDLRLRQGLAFALPALHFYAPAHDRVRREGNPFAGRPEKPEERFLDRRNVIVRPEARALEEYGVRYWLSNLDLERELPGKFRRVFQGEYASVFENPAAEPVAHFLDDPGTALPLRHAGQGLSVELPAGRGGELSVALDLRRASAQALDGSGRATPLALREPGESGSRWIAEVPAGSSAVLFTPEEAGGLRLLGAAAGAGFLLSLGWVGRL